jgi:hypothetical protein
MSVRSPIGSVANGRAVANARATRRHPNRDTVADVRRLRRHAAAYRRPVPDNRAVAEGHSVADGNSSPV